MSRSGSCPHVLGLFILTLTCTGGPHAAHAAGRVIITEIMYNPASDEQRGETEWVEIANVGDEAIRLDKWKLDDEDKAGWGEFSITLDAGGVAVLVNKDAITEKLFRDAWAPAPGSGRGDGHDDVEQVELIYQVIPITWASLANSPDEENEILTLNDGEGETVCEVNIQAEGDWPHCSGQSIWLADLTLTRFNDGTAWKLSEDGENGARAGREVGIFCGKDVGSPGYVPTLTKDGVKAKPASEENADTPEPEEDEGTIDY